MEKTLYETVLQVLDQVNRVILGKEKEIREIMTAFLAGGHVLLEDIPGVGKTTMAVAFSRAMQLDYKRVQFTPDVLPSDLTGFSIYRREEEKFVYQKGSIFCNLLLADEINRATPRTQSSLLEAMEERQITVDGVTTVLQEPFMVMATQNPLESYGTFPLPDAQIDRFFMKLSLGYMEREQEKQVLKRPASSVEIIEGLHQVVTEEETDYVRQAYTEVRMPDEVLDYLMNIIEETRRDSHFLHGVSTRGAIALYKAAQVTAAFDGRDYVIPEDVKAMAPHVLAHRVAEGNQGRTAAALDYFRKMLEKIPVPLENV